MERDGVKEGEKREVGSRGRERRGERETEEERGCLVETKEQESISRSEFYFSKSRKEKKWRHSTKNARKQ